MSYQQQTEMDAEPDDTITTSSEIDDGQHPDSPMQQSPDQSDFNENYRSPESINSVPLDEDIDEIIKDVEFEEGDAEQSGQDEEHTEVGMEVPTSDKSENEAFIGGMGEAEAKSDVSEGENEVSFTAIHGDINIMEENSGVDLESTNKMEENSGLDLENTNKMKENSGDGTNKMEDNSDEDLESTNKMEEYSGVDLESTNKMEENSSEDLENTNKMAENSCEDLESTNKTEENGGEDLENTNKMEENSGVADTSSAIIADHNVGSEEDSHVSQSNLDTNEVSSTSIGENFETQDDRHKNADNSLDDVSDADSDDFKPNNTLDDISDENSDDFNDEGNVNQSDLCTSSHDIIKNDEESVTNTVEASNSDLNVQASDNVGISVTTDSRTTVGDSNIESADSSAADQCLKENLNAEHDMEDLTVSDSAQQTKQTEVHSEETSAILRESETNEVENKGKTLEVGYEILS